MTTYKMAFRQTSQKAPKTGVFSPKSSQGTPTGSLPGSAITILCSRQLSSTFWKVLEKSNGRIKSYEAKSVIFGQFGHFGALLTLFEPLGTQSGFFQKSKNTIPLLKLSLIHI